MSHLLLKRCPVALVPAPPGPRPLRFSHRVSLGPDCPPLELGAGHMARLADGAAEARLGSTAVLSTVCRGRVTSPGFLPLTVDYRQKAAAAGRLPANLLRRELGASEREILVSRMIDRSVRPLAARGWPEEVGVTCNLLAVDSLHDPDVLAINSTSLALALSSLPWTAAVGAVRVGHSGGRPVLNPSRRELARSRVNLVVAATAGGQVTMLEGDARNVGAGAWLECVEAGLEQCAAIAASIDQLAGQHGKTKAAVAVGDNEALVEKVRMLTKGRLRSVFTDSSLDKLARDKLIFSIRDEAVAGLTGKNEQLLSHQVAEAFNAVSKETVRDLILDEDTRVDGRSLRQLRPISCEADLYQPLHGSALFTRGQTQVLCTVTLDSLHNALKLDPMSVITGGLKEKNFLLHYEFPSYATGDVKSAGGGAANRRETGHGALAERALRQVVPGTSPWTVRLTSEVLESNGSSSMASVCGGTLALMDAGIRLEDRVSGVALGLVTRAGQHRVLTDILGLEDFMGDMDFKFAGTRTGVCAVQADVKIPGIPLEVIRESVERGMEANNQILDIMDRCLDKPRESKSSWPVTKQLQIPAHKRGKFLGPGGLNVKRLSGDTGVQVHAEEEGGWTLFAPSQEAMTEAEQMVDLLLAEEKVPELEFGAVYTARILELSARGALLELGKGLEPMLCATSQLDARKVAHPSALGLAEGQDIQVKYYGRDPVTGQVRLSRKVLTTATAAAVASASSMKRNEKHKAQKDKDKDDGVKGGKDEDSTEPPSGPSDSHSQQPASQNQVNFSSPSSDIITNLPPVIQNVETTPSLSGSGIILPTTPSEEDLSSSKICSEPEGDAFGIVTDEQSEQFQKFKSFQSDNETCDPEEEDNQKSIEEKYYHIDILINQVIRLKFEMQQTSLKRQETLQKLEKVKSTLNFLNRPDRGSLILVDAFHKDTMDSYRRLLSKIKAIDESLLLLQRQYDDTKAQAEVEKLNFINSRKSNYESEEEVVTLSPEVSSEGTKYNTFQPAHLMSRDKWTGFGEEGAATASLKSTEENNQLDTTAKTPLAENLPSPDLDDDDNVKKAQNNYYRKLKKTTENTIPKPTAIRRKASRKNDEKLRINSKVLSDKGMAQLDDKEAEMREIAENYSCDKFLLCKPWVTPPVLKFVEQSVQDFQTLLTWLEDLQSAKEWNDQAVKDVTFGLGCVHANAVKNLREIEMTYKYVLFDRDQVYFIQQYVNKPEHYMLKAANSSCDKLEELHEKTVNRLGDSDVNLSKRIDQKWSQEWKEYHTERKKLKDIKDKLVEIESHEEKVAELDDWREEAGHFSSPSIAAISVKIDIQNKKINRFTREDVNNKWMLVDKDLKKLQLLRVEGLMTWLKELPRSERPHWLCDGLYSYMEATAREYQGLEAAAVVKGSWISQERDGDYDLMLDMAYSRLRTSINRVKYGRIENKRHGRELQLYSAWLADHRHQLRASTVSLLEGLMAGARDKVAEVEAGLGEYVASLEAGNKEVATAAAETLETVRQAKRNMMKELVSHIKYSWNKEGRDGRHFDFVTYKL